MPERSGSWHAAGDPVPHHHPHPHLNFLALAGTPSSYTCAVSAGWHRAEERPPALLAETHKPTWSVLASLAIKSCDGGRGRNIGMAEAAYRNLANRDAGKKNKQPRSPKSSMATAQVASQAPTAPNGKTRGKKSINEEKTSSFIRPQHVRRLSPMVSRRSLAHKLS